MQGAARIKIRQELQRIGPNPRWTPNGRCASPSPQRRSPTKAAAGCGFYGAISMLILLFLAVAGYICVDDVQLLSSVRVTATVHTRMDGAESSRQHQWQQQQQEAGAFRPDEKMQQEQQDSTASEEQKRQLERERLDVMARERKRQQERDAMAAVSVPA